MSDRGPWKVKEKITSATINELSLMTKCHPKGGGDFQQKVTGSQNVGPYP